jgi:hypothetical protein
VPHHDFVFSVDVADEGPHDAMLATIAEALVRHAGCGTEAAGQILDGLRRALVEGTAAGLHQCHIEFRATSRQLQIVVAYVGGREWRATHALP